MGKIGIIWLFVVSNVSSRLIERRVARWVKNVRYVKSWAEELQLCIAQRFTLESWGPLHKEVGQILVLILKLDVGNFKMHSLDVVTSCVRFARHRAEFEIKFETKSKICLTFLWNGPQGYNRKFSSSELLWTTIFLTVSRV